MPPPAESAADLRFPLAGIDLSFGHDRQVGRNVGGRPAQTCFSALNVRGYDPYLNRQRGGSRPGIVKWKGPVLDANGVRHLNVVQTGGGSVADSESGLQVTLVAVGGGNVYYAGFDDAAFTQSPNLAGGTTPLHTTNRPFSSTLLQKLYIVDGENYRYFDPADNSVHDWTTSAGAIPRDSNGKAARLIVTWRGRIVLSGLVGDPQGVFMSAVDDATNFDYSPASQTPTQALAFEASREGQVGDIVTCLIPYSDDILIIGCDSSIWMLKGDPFDGGRLSLVTQGMGMVWGVPWCRSPDGTVYFQSNNCGVYALVPGQSLVRISQPIEQWLMPPLQLTDSEAIHMTWDDRFQWVNLWRTPFPTGPTSGATHLCYEARSGAWWVDQFGALPTTASGLDPISSCVVDGPHAGDRVVLIGCWDGYVREIDPTAPDDDGTAITSHVWLGPILTRDLDAVMLKELQAVIASGSGDVRFDVFTDLTTEAAVAHASSGNPFTADPQLTGTFTAGRSSTQSIRVAGHAIYVMLFSNVRWAMESVRGLVVSLGRVRRRGPK